MISPEGGSDTVSSQQVIDALTTLKPRLYDNNSYGPHRCDKTCIKEGEVAWARAVRSAQNTPKSGGVSQGNISKPFYPSNMNYRWDIEVEESGQMDH